MRHSEGACRFSLCLGFAHVAPCVLLCLLLLFHLCAELFRVCKNMACAIPLVTALDRLRECQYVLPHVLVIAFFSSFVACRRAMLRRLLLVAGLWLYVPFLCSIGHSDLICTSLYRFGFEVLVHGGLSLGYNVLGTIWYQCL